MKENKSPGVDRISPKILKETVEHNCSPLAYAFKMSLFFKEITKWVDDALPVNVIYLDFQKHLIKFHIKD